MPGLTQQAESYKTPTPVGKAGRAWCPDQYPDITIIFFLMSLEIDPAKISAVFALGQWHYVAPNSFGVDAYELVRPHPISSDRSDIRALGDLYPEDKQAHLGACWKTQCGERMAMPLFEVKAYKFLWDDAVEKPKPVEIKPLTGEDLLNKVRQVGNVSKSKLVEACGYIIPAKSNNKPRLDYTAFYEALLNAKGVDMDQLEKEASK